MTDAKFLSFEGIDGCGKSTQAKRLAAHLTTAGQEVVLTREPGGSPGAEAIRQLLLTGATDKWSAETELLLFTAARRDHLERTITPALSAGKMVIYQGATRGDLRGKVDQLHSAMIGREPDLTLIIDVDPEIALTRGLARNSGEDRFEDFGLPFQQHLRAGFLALAAQYPQRCRIIDGNRSPEAIFTDVLALATS
jgi:dTMP kinase